MKTFYASENWEPKWIDDYDDDDDGALNDDDETIDDGMSTALSIVSVCWFGWVVLLL